LAVRSFTESWIRPVGIWAGDIPVNANKMEVKWKETPCISKKQSAGCNFQLPKSFIVKLIFFISEACDRYETVV